MNCLLLLIILFCCGGNGNCSGSCVRGNSGCAVRENTCDRMDSTIHSCPTQNTASRTQFPYLDVEPRTCGCEEKSNS